MDITNVIFLLNDNPVIIGGEDEQGNDTSSSTGSGDGNTNNSEPAPGLNPMVMILIWVAVIAVFYLITIRPQRKREKKTQEMQASIKVGDNVITAGGFYGKIMDVGEDCFVVEFGTNRGVRIPVRKTEILGIKSPVLTPIKHDGKDDKDTSS